MTERRPSLDRATQAPLPSPPDRLVQSVWTLWETLGHAAISARALAQHADVPISSLYNHFPSLDHVFLQAQRDALTQAQAWCSTQMEQLFFCDTPQAGTFVPQDFGRILSVLIDEWTHSQRRLAFAWREGFLLGQRDPRFAPLWQEWRSLWSGFWQTLCTRCGMDNHGAWTAFVFEGEAALHMLPWRRTLDRACLEELCAGWAAWLSGDLVPEGPWRQRARQQAIASAPDLSIHDAPTRRIAAAAADVVEHQGMARLTHRAVAAAAGVSLGMVSSRFRTSVDLVRAAFEMTYRRAAQPGHNQPDEQAPDDDRRAIEERLPSLTGEQISVSRRLALEELMLAVARTPDLQAFAPQLRYLRGRTSGRVLQALAGPDIAISPLDAALFSDLLSGMQRSGIDLSPTSRADTGKTHIERLLQHLGLPQLPPG